MPGARERTNARRLRPDRLIGCYRRSWGREKHTYTQMAQITHSPGKRCDAKNSSVQSRVYIWLAGGRFGEGGGERCAGKVGKRSVK